MGLRRHLLLVLVVFGLALAVSPALAPFERRAWDARLRMRQDGGWPRDLVLVRIDDDSIEGLGKRWPWPRDLQARLLRRLRTLGVRTIFYDAVPEGASDPDADRALAASLDRVVIAVGYHGGREERETPAAVIQGLTLRNSEAPRFTGSGFVTANDLFAGSALGQGHITTFSDPDRVVRRFPPALGVRGRTGAIPMGSLLAWALHRGIEPGEIVARADRLILPGRELSMVDGGIPLDFVPGSRLRPLTLSAGTVLDETRDDASLRQSLEGRIAIVYVDSLFTPDVITTPMLARTPGGLLHGYVVRTLDGGRVPLPAPAGLGWALVLIAAAVLAWRSLRVSALALARRFAVTALGYGALSLALVPASDRLLPVVGPLLFLVTAMLGLVVLSSRALEQDRSRLKALLEAATSDERATRATAGPASFPGPIADPSSAQVVLGRYEIVRRLGRGGMGAVYLARDRDLSREVAIKVLETASGEGYARFRREALAVARLSHPNVVQIHEVGFDEQVPYLVMEYLPGGTVSDAMRDRDEPMHWKVATRIAADVARGLGAAHARGVVHRDVKPANVLLVEGGKLAKVADFGIAKLAGESGLTREGWFVGTLGYASPEQVRGEPVDARSDVYSLGITWYRMLTGIAAFHGEVPDIIRQTSTEPVPDPRFLLPELPLAVSELLARMCALDPADRPPTGDAAAVALDALSG